MLDRRTETPPRIEPVGSGSAPAPGLSRYSMLAPFRARSFRFQWPSDLLTSWAIEMETLILGWYVLVETGSVLWLTAFGALQYLGTLVAPLFGVAGDRIGHRNLLCGMRVSYAVFAGALMALAFADAMTPLAALVIATLTGIARPSDIGVRAALVAETMPSDQMIGAMSISRTTTDSARAAGALTGAGLFALFGMGPAYLIIVAFYVASALLLFGVAPPARHISMALTDDPASSPWRDLKAGMAQVWNTPVLLAVVGLAFLANLTAFPITGGLLPYVAKDIYGMDQTGLGYLVASFAGGALIGSLALSHAGTGTHLARMMILSTLVWYALLLGFAQMPGPVGGITFLLIAGFMQSLCMVPLAIILLRAAGDKFRGRVMGVRMMAIYSLPIGLLVAGPLIDRIGFRAMASLYAIIGIVFTVIIAVRWRAELWRV